MKKQYFFISILLLFCQFTKAQNKPFFSLEFKAISELATPIKKLSLSWNDKNALTLGYGIGIDFKYSIRERFFLKMGSNLLNRRFESVGTLNQAAFYPEGTKLIEVAYSVNKLSYQILEFHTGFGYRFLKKGKLTYSTYAEFGLYEVISATYSAGGDAYDNIKVKQDMFGTTFLLGLQAEIDLSKSLLGIIGIETSINNIMSNDKYVDSPDRNKSNVPHNFYRINLGIQKQF